ncbi:MAG TPA: hypothetical protein VFE42_20765 [Chloroflexota bacterium]|nr:hypothetical protein [Chloroflexota bacterium]
MGSRRTAAGASRGRSMRHAGRIIGNPTPSQIVHWLTQLWLEQQAAKVPGSQGRGQQPVRRYAESTAVPSDPLRTEIERTVERYGARRFAYGWQDDSAMVALEMGGRLVRLFLPLPRRDDRAITHTPTGLLRDEKTRAEAYEQAIRQRWRALALVVKAKLEAVEAGISRLEREFLADIVVPSTGQTVGDLTIPQLTGIDERGEMPRPLPGPDCTLRLEGPSP